MTPGILIADAGSTKTDWSFIDKKTGHILRIKTPGINPVQHSHEEIISSMTQAKGLFDKNIGNVYFFGAGCVGDTNRNEIRDCIAELGIDPDKVEVDSDMAAAAKALFGNDKGVACILGTGSNSCLVENGKIITKIPSLGYVLGDEGSGASLGKRLINNIYKHQLDPETTSAFLREFNLSVEQIIEKVYKQPAPAAFLASFSPFILRHIDSRQIHEMVLEEFDSFFIKNILPYSLPVPVKAGFIGSVAYNFADVLKSSAQKFGVVIAKILKEPMSSLEIYYSGK